MAERQLEQLHLMHGHGTSGLGSSRSGVPFHANGWDLRRNLRYLNTRLRVSVGKSKCWDFEALAQRNPPESLIRRACCAIPPASAR